MSDRKLHDSEVLSRDFLSARAFNSLTRAGYMTVGDVRAETDVELLHIRGFGRGLLRHVRQHCEFNRLAKVASEFKPAPDPVKARLVEACKALLNIMYEVPAHGMCTGPRGFHELADLRMAVEDAEREAQPKETRQ